jgi:hypothetical protein
MVALAGVGSYGSLFSHKNRTQLPSRLQLHDSTRLVRVSDIFDSHRPLHFQPSLANASQSGSSRSGTQ